MITLILQSSLCWLGFLLIYYLFLKKETFFRFNRYYLVGTLILGVLIPLWRMMWEKISPNPVDVISFATFQGTAQILEVASTNRTGFDVLKWLTLIYWLGVMVFLLILVRQIWTILNTIKKHPKQKFKDYTLVSTDYAHLPFSFLGYVFISTKVEFKDEEMNRILRHEGSHVQGGHSLDILLIEVIKALAWFSPLVYWYKQMMRNTHEYLADALVLKSCDTNSYGQLLINNAQQGLQMALANHFIYSQLKNRINMMLKSPSKRRNVLKYALIIPVLFMLGVMFAYKSDQAYSKELKSVPSLSTNDSIPDNVLYFLNGEKSTAAEVKNVLPLQITSVHVIKDKEALKSYGEEGKNGVIQITTRTLYLVNDVESSKEAIDKIDPKEIESLDVIKFGASTLGIVKVTLKDKTIKSDPAPLRVVQQMPEYPGGEVALIKYLAENIKYPAEAKEKNIQGRVIMQFIVGADGNITNPKVLRGIGAGCDTEAIRVLNKMNIDRLFWKPGVHEGKSVPVIFTLPIAFKLDDSREVDSAIPPPPPPVLLNPVQKADEMPQFPGGQEKLFSFISEQLRYPRNAKDSGIQGKVILTFTVSEDGVVYDTKVIKGIGGGCDEESVRMVNSMNRLGIQWIPAKLNGKSVAVKYTLPLSFKLIGDEGKNENNIIHTNQPQNKITQADQSSLRIIPNPATHQIDVKWNKEGKVTIEIIDISGRVVQQNMVPDFRSLHTMDVRTLARGTYIIRLQQGSVVEEQKLILN